MKPRLVALSCVVLASPAADAEPAWPDYLDVDLTYRNSAAALNGRPWDLRLGLGVENEPTYQGSDRSESEVDPYLVATWRADWGNLFLSGNGLGYSRMLTPSFGLMLQLEAEDTREIEDDDRLQGLGDQQEELELEIVGRYFMGPWSVGASVAPATGDKGVVWFVGGGYAWRTLDDRLFVNLNADLSGSNADNQRTDFGITSAQSQATGYPEFDPDGGLKSFGLSVSLDYKVNDRWFVFADVDYERLLGDVADSPLVADIGSENNVEFGIGFYYRF